MANLKRKRALISFDDIGALEQVYVGLGTSDMDGGPLFRLEGIFWAMYMEIPVPPSSRKASNNLIWEQPLDRVFPLGWIPGNRARHSKIPTINRNYKEREYGEWLDTDFTGLWIGARDGALTKLTWPKGETWQRAFCFWNERFGMLPTNTKLDHLARTAAAYANVLPAYNLYLGNIRN